MGFILSGNSSVTLNINILEHTVHSQEDAEREVECAVRNCLNFQRAVIARHTRLSTALAEERRRREREAAVATVEEEEEEKGQRSGENDGRMGWKWPHH